METSGLLPTPEAKNHVGYQVANGKQYPRLGRVISSLEVSPVSPSPTQESGKGQMMTATYGRRCVESFKSFPRATSWQKTFVDCLVSKGEWYSRQCVLTWKLSATKSNRLFFQLVPSTPRTEEIESGLLLATPNTMDAMAPKTKKAVLREATETRPGRKKFANLRDQLYHGIKMNPIQGGKSRGLKLQPDFAGHLMGFPPGWTDLSMMG